MGSFFIKFGEGIIKFCLYFINLFTSLEDNIKNKKNSNQGDINQDDNKNNVSKSNINNINSNKSKFSLTNLKSLFFNEEFKEEVIFQNLENKSSKSKFNYNSNSKSKKGFLSKTGTLTSSNINKLNSFRDGENNNQSLFNELTEKILVNIRFISKFGLYFIVFFVIILILLGYFIVWEISLAILIVVLLIFLTILYKPKMKTQSNSVQFSRELPYALRQLATELKSGKSLFNSLESVVQADYGVLSFEFFRVLEEIKYGETTEDAFIRLENRIDSEALSRVVREILSTLRVGGNLASSLSIIAEDINFDMRMKLKDYAQRLNAFIMIYTFIAILAPVVLLTLLLAASTVMGDIVPGDLLLILYGVFFPMLIIFLGFMIKKLEPKI